MNQRRRQPDPRSDEELAVRMNVLEARMRPYEQSGVRREPLYLALRREWLALRGELAHRHTPAEARTQHDGSDPF